MHTSVRHHRSFSFQLIRTEKLGQIFHCENFSHGEQRQCVVFFHREFVLKHIDNILECFSETLIVIKILMNSDNTMKA